jgi:hypothetical protein
MPPEGAKRAVKVRVPGKIMLAGEYAVLSGGYALASAVDAFLSLNLESTAESGVWVASNLWPTPRRLTAQRQGEPLLDSLQDLQSSSAHVSVASDLNVAHGLGSSSAVRLAAHLAIDAFEKQKTDLSSIERWNAARAAWQAQKIQQGFASGYDFVTQLQGGCVLWAPDFERWPGRVDPYDLDWLKDHVHPYVGGKGAPTGIVGGSIRSYLDEGNLWPKLLSASNTLVGAFTSRSLDAVIAANSRHRALFEPAPFYPQKIYKLLASLPEFDRSWSFKTTGAGGEDAILLLGVKAKLAEADRALRQEGWTPLLHSFTTQGASIRWGDKSA